MRSALALAILFPAAAIAQPIPITNHSFESPVQSPGGFTIGSAPGWSAVGGSGDWGVFYPTIGTWNYITSHGNQLLYTNGSVLEHSTGAALQAGETYTLRIDVINRPSFGGNPYFIELYAGTTLLARDNNSLMPPVGGFLASVLRYTSPPGDPLAGQPLRIRVGGAAQSNFDNIRLATRDCYANCDSSTAAPILNVNDFICFQQRYAASDPAANCDGSTAIPTLNVNDFICFQTLYSAGCT